MKTVSSIMFVLLLAVALCATSCSASKKNNCGCPNKQGMVGY
ncbi:MAG: hypothetical protein ABIP35_04910 [Ginsengibacter sp.]